MTIELLRDILKVESSNSVINGSISEVFSSVHKVDNRAILDPKLGAVPTLRIADEEEITEKVNTLAELIGDRWGVISKRGESRVRARWLGNKDRIREIVERINSKVFNANSEQEHKL